MSSVQVVLIKKPNKRNLHPLAIRITRDRKSRYLFLGQYLDPANWDDVKKRVKKSHPNAISINNLLLKKLSEANASLLEAETSNEGASLNHIKRKLQGRLDMDFFGLADLHLENLRNAEKFRVYETQKGRIQKFKSFVGQERLPFKSITVFLIKNFESYILTKKGRKRRTAVNYMILIRKIYNLAISEGLVDRKYYPFGKGKIQIRIPESEKIGLSVDELRMLENARGLTTAQHHALNVWLTSFYFAGIRVSDVLQLRWSDFRDGRLLYRMNKNQKLVSLKVPEKARAILDTYKDPSRKDDDLVFHHMEGTNFRDAKELLTRTRSATRSLNRRLQLIADQLGIKKKLSMHIARHSFGNISGDKIPIQMLQKLYRHSSITTTVAYQATFMRREADDALDTVVNF